MSRSLEAELHEAIRDNDFALVTSCLEKGADVNYPSPESFFSVSYAVASYGEWVKKSQPSASKASCMYPLHWAILNCFQNGAKSCHSPNRILKALLKHGAEPNSRVSNLTICTVDSKKFYRWTPLISGCVDTRGLFRTLLGNTTSSDNHSYVQEARTLVQQFYTLPSCYQIRSSYHDNVIGTMNTLLLSERFSDVRFVCPDGTTLHAHCAILGAKSLYFSTMFEGPWKETNADGIWKTCNSSSVMDAILRFIYVGKIVPTVLQNETNELLMVASEYQMSDLQEICVQQCAHDLSPETIKDTLLMAYLHNISHLKEACLKFVKSNALKLGKSNILADLSSSESTADIWRDLVEDEKKELKSE